MRKCDYCGKEIPLGSKIVEVRVFGYKFEENFDFCSPECFEYFFAYRRWKLHVIEKGVKATKKVKPT
jgi:ribosomal protein L24E